VFIANQMVCPVLMGKPDAAGPYKVNGNVLGTCFSVGGGFCLTAGHVVSELEARPNDTTALIAVPQDEAWSAVPVSGSEILDADIGVLKYSVAGSSLNDMPVLAWNLENLPVLAPVRTVGYPYGLYMVDDERSIVARAFSGEVACTLPRFRPPGFRGPAFSVHELSFAAPCGLSGAPLLTACDPPTVKGIVIGNSSSEMRVAFETETDADDADEQSSHTVERVERLSLGIAVRAVHIASLDSSLLGRTVAEHLRGSNLLA